MNKKAEGLDSGWQTLKAGDTVDVIAPAGRLPQENLNKIIQLLESWGLKVKVANDIFGDDLLCANTDAARLQHLQDALLNSTSKMVVCARGGYGATRLLPELFKLARPGKTKLFVGMSDITALQLFLQQRWGWPTLHAAVTPWRLHEASIAQLKSIILGEVTAVSFSELQALNDAAQQNGTIHASVTGGNLCLLQCSLGTPWRIEARDKIILIEETGERGYKVDRMLEHLRQADIFEQAKAIVFGDFLKGEEPNGTSLIDAVLRRFAQRLTIPVVQISGVGHGADNKPVPLGMPAELKLGKALSLICRLQSKV